jgi:hypothetical protein
MKEKLIEKKKKKSKINNNKSKYANDVIVKCQIKKQISFNFFILA